VVEDAAHALGSSVDGRAVGSISRATCFSFYATKNLPIVDSVTEYPRRPSQPVVLGADRRH
jgi:hypothetical protein